MSWSHSIVRQLARLLMRVVSWLMPEEKTEWAAAMRAEMLSLEGDYVAAAWAFGCLAVAIRTRINTMIVGDLRISKWVLVLEIACCFLPLTLFWLLLLSDGFDPAVITQYLVAPDDIIVLVYLLSMAVLGSCGPIGLFVAFQHIAMGRSVRHYPLGVLIVGLTLLGIVYAGSTLVLGGPGQWLLGVLLFVILPVVGAAHLRYLAWKEPVQQSVA
jgi:hypothetical protein